VSRRSRRDPGALPRFCRETRSALPALVDGELTGWSRRVVDRHLRRCADCRVELARQRDVAAALQHLRAASPEPPARLIEDLLGIARRRGIRQRVAVPARGAVSGARPALSVAFLTVGAVASTGAGWAIWRGARRLRRR
jgi:predicted anti-sigma-YlaC factor YlaD